MLTPREILEIVDTLQPQVDELNTWITKDIISRVMARIGRGSTPMLTGTDQWQLQVYQEAGGHLEAVQQEIARWTKKSDAEIRRIFEDAGIKALSYDSSFYVEHGLEALDLAQSESMIRLLEDSYQRTAGTVHNFTRTTAQASQQRLIKILDTVHFKVASGAASYTQAVQEALGEIVDHQTTVSYPSGHTDTIETAVLRAVRTGIAQASGNLAIQGMIERDWDVILVSAHIGARYGDGGENPGNHFWWQGKFYTRTGATPGLLPFSVTGYGTGEGLSGWNCRHSFGPGDVSHNPFQHFDTEENKRAYDLSQKQRSMERNIRKRKGVLEGYQAALENCADDSIRQKLQEAYDRGVENLARKNKAYNAFCEENGLKRFDDRLQLARWNRSQASKSVTTARKIEKFKENVKAVDATSTGVKITDVSTHVYSRAQSRGLSSGDVTDALTNPLKLGKIRKDGSQQFIGERCTAAINIETGKVITCWPTSSGTVIRLKGGRKS